MAFSLVVPTIGRQSLAALLDSLQSCTGPRPDSIEVVDDRVASDAGSLSDLLPTGWAAGLIRVHKGGGLGPAHARNVGWVHSSSEWVVFLDDDVLLTPSWLADLDVDLAGAGADVAGITGRLSVPLPVHRRATDFERSTAGLQSAHWITADMAYRRSVLAAVAGFDERFPRAFREDADLALRVLAAGNRLVRGSRQTVHPVRSAGWWMSVRQQRGNADDALMLRLHGSDWHSRAHAEKGQRQMHWLSTAAAAVAVLAGLAGYRRTAALGALGWGGLTARFAAMRIKPGPRDPAEIARMVSTSIAIPPVATYHWLAGLRRTRRAPAWSAIAPSRLRSDARQLAAVLVDRDGTIVRNVAFNGDPAKVEPMPGARDALDRIRARGLPVGVLTNQSGIARGLLSAEQVQAVNDRVEQLLGPFDTWQICPHAAVDCCSCRKPAPGMVLAAAKALGVAVQDCVVIGDIGADVQAALAAGATGLLVPTPETLGAEVQAAPAVFGSINGAVDHLLATRSVVALQP